MSKSYSMGEIMRTALPGWDLYTFLRNVGDCEIIHYSAAEIEQGVELLEGLYPWNAERIVIRPGDEVVELHYN